MDSDFGPTSSGADRALEDGSLNGVHALMDHIVKDGLGTKYQADVDARELATKVGTIDADRERVEAELLFEKYVYGLYETARGATIGGEGAEGAVNQVAEAAATAEHSH